MSNPDRAAAALAYLEDRGYSIRYSAPVFHLWHDRPYVRADVIAQNRAILEETRRTRAAWTEAGMRK